MFEIDPISYCDMIARRDHWGPYWAKRKCNYTQKNFLVNQESYKELRLKPCLIDKHGDLLESFPSINKN